MDDDEEQVDPPNDIQDTEVAKGSASQCDPH